MGDAVYGAGFGSGLLLFIGKVGTFAVRKEAMGGGDVAMLGLVGCYLGWQSVLFTLFLGSVVGILIEKVILPLIVLLKRLRPGLSRAPASDDHGNSPQPALEVPRTWSDKLFLASLPLVLLLGMILSSVSSIEMIGAMFGGMFVGLGTGYLLLSVVEFVRPSRVAGSTARTVIYGAAGVLGILTQVLHRSFSEALGTISAAVLCGHLVTSAVPSWGAGAEQPLADPIVELSSEDLRRMTYIPFGVSLVIAGLIATFVGPATITKLVAEYLQRVG